MKVFPLALLTLLLVALWTGSQGASLRSSYSMCCYKNMLIREKIPASRIKKYQETPSHCSRKAMIVEVRSGRKFCVDPKEGWFQEYLQQKKSNTTSM
ncbi:C-C motif chemokine 13-like [Phalacrocorax aristotelis]|uniref:C-C motif chemokine 13-like n=1 Tax=Phalacrocorax aristotelis TaxID=126867 RepID=UPI003F4C53B3